jgi:hypothetical protein
MAREKPVKKIAKKPKREKPAKKIAKKPKREKPAKKIAKKKPKVIFKGGVAYDANTGKPL